MSIHNIHTELGSACVQMFPTGYFDQSEIDKIMEESLKMKHFKHRHVMGLIGVCLDAGPAPYIIMPYMANGSLQSYLKRERKSLVLGLDADEDRVREAATTIVGAVVLSTNYMCMIIHILLGLLLSSD